MSPEASSNVQAKSHNLLCFAGTEVEFMVEGDGKYEVEWYRLAGNDAAPFDLMYLNFHTYNNFKHCSGAPSPLTMSEEILKNAVKKADIIMFNIGKLQKGYFH